MNKIVNDLLVETLQGFFRLKLRRKGILIDKELMDMVCNEMIMQKEEEEEENNDLFMEESDSFPAQQQVNLRELLTKNEDT